MHATEIIKFLEAKFSRGESSLMRALSALFLGGAVMKLKNYFISIVWNIVANIIEATVA